MSWRWKLSGLKSFPCLYYKWFNWHRRKMFSAVSAGFLALFLCCLGILSFRKFRFVSAYSFVCVCILVFVGGDYCLVLFSVWRRI